MRARNLAPPALRNEEGFHVHRPDGYMIVFIVLMLLLLGIPLIVAL
jgi:hypothetical protein